MTEGKVKWLNNEKGFGFIYTNELDDHFFRVKDINGFDLPNVGDVVEFESNSGQKGLFATGIKIISKKDEKDKILCPGCNKKVAPKTIRNPRKKVTVPGNPNGWLAIEREDSWEWQDAYISGNCPLCGYEIWRN